jgi:hypothetical protein
MNWANTRIASGTMVGDLGLIAKMDINLERRPVNVKIPLLQSMIYLLILQMNPIILLMNLLILLMNQIIPHTINLLILLNMKILEDQYRTVGLNAKQVVGVMSVLEVGNQDVLDRVLLSATNGVVQIVVELGDIMMNVNLVRKRPKHELVVPGANGLILMNVPNLVTVVRKLVPENVSVEMMMNLILNLILKILEDQYPTVSLNAKQNVTVSVLEVTNQGV